MSCREPRARFPGSARRQIHALVAGVGVLVGAALPAAACEAPRSAPGERSAVPGGDATAVCVTAAFARILDSNEASERGAEGRSDGRGPCDRALNALLEALASGRRPAAEGASSSTRLAPRARASILRAFGEVPPATLDRLVTARQDRSPDAGERRALIDVVGTYAGGRGVARLVGLVEGLPADTPAYESRTVVEAYEGALARVLARDPAALGALERRWARLPPPVADASLRAVAESGVREGLAFVGGVLEYWPERRGEAVKALASLAPLARAEDRRATWRGLRAVLEDRASGSIQAAARASGRLGEERAVPLLIEILRVGSKGDRVCAAEALRTLTGLRFRAEAEPWDRWYAETRLWWRHRADTALDTLANGSRVRTLAALRQVATIRLRRDELAKRVEGVLARPDARLRAAACDTLASLGTPGAAEALEFATQDPAEDVREAAQRALRAIGGSNGERRTQRGRDG